MAWTVDYDDFDEVVVDRIFAGRRVGAPISAADAAEAVRRLAAAGFSDGQIAFRLGFTRRSVLRIRRRRAIAAALPIGANGHDRPVDAPNRLRNNG